MVAKQLLQRLARLEAKQAVRQKKLNLSDDNSNLYFVLIAYHLGEMNSTESLRLALARGLGYETTGKAEFEVIFSEYIDFKSRFQDAVHRLYALCDTDINTDYLKSNQALKKLLFEMPKWCDKHLACMGFNSNSLLNNMPNRLSQ